MKRLAVIMGILIILSPLGIIIPGLFKAQGAWGEWDTGTLKNMAGFIPEGIKKLSDLWHPVMPDYNIRKWTDAGILKTSSGYLVSGLVGAGLAWIIAYIFFHWRIRE